MSIRNVKFGENEWEGRYAMCVGRNAADACSDDWQEQGGSRKIYAALDGFYVCDDFEERNVARAGRGGGQLAAFSLVGSRHLLLW
jgi:hypothetical protein